MKSWFLSLTQRERVMVQVASSVVTVFLLYLLVLDPISTNYSKNKKNVQAATETLEWMRNAASEVKRLRGGRQLSERPQGKQFVLSMIDSSVRKVGLAAVMKRVQPEGDSGVRVWFEAAAFDELIKWLATIESEHGLLVNEINVEQTDTVGLVNARILLDS